MVQCKIGIVGSSRVEELFLNDGTTLAQALAMTKLASEAPRTFKRNSITIDMNTVLNNGDVVFGFENIKGAMPIAKIARIPGQAVEELVLPEGITFGQAIQLASQVAAEKDINFSADLSKSSIRFEGIEVSSSSVIPAGRDEISITIYESMKGALIVIR